jgi:hypothetical protein
VHGPVPFFLWRKELLVVTCWRYVTITVDPWVQPDRGGNRQVANKNSSRCAALRLFNKLAESRKCGLERDLRCLISLCIFI